MTPCAAKTAESVSCNRAVNDIRPSSSQHRIDWRISSVTTDLALNTSSLPMAHRGN